MAASLTILVAGGGVPSGAPSAQADGVVYGPSSPRRLVVDIKHDTNSNATLYRWSGAFEEWVPVIGGAQAITANTIKQLVWETNGLPDSYFALGASAGATGTWQPLPAAEGP